MPVPFSKNDLEYPQFQKSPSINSRGITVKAVMLKI